MSRLLLLVGSTSVWSVGVLVAMAATVVEPALAQPSARGAAFGPERDALFSATWLGQVGEEEGAKVAVSWGGDGPVWVEVFEDTDGDGRLGKGERVVLQRAVEKGMEVVAVAGGGGVGALGLRWRGDGAEGTEALRPAEPSAFTAGCGTFPGAQLSAGTSPYSVAIGDLDGDGHVDLAVANFSSNNVSILLGSGSGSFAAAVNYGVGSSPRSVAIGDLDGDGHADLAVANAGSSNVSILLGSGSGAFAAAVNYGVGSLPRSVAIGDLDGDGHADLAVANGNSNTVSILLGSGDGTFAAAVNYGVGTTPTSVAIGDLDGDGDTDLAVANGNSNTVSILLRSGSGTFAAPVNYAVGSSPSSVAIGDLDGDGDADLAVANAGSSNVSILLGSGDGTFAAAVNYGVGTTPTSVAIGDLNGDGDTDLAVANFNSNNVSILLGSGSGSFAAAVNYGVGTNPISVAIGDLDGDGHVDLAVANNTSSNVSILVGSGSGTFAAAVNYGVGSFPISVAIGDLDGDGHVDLAVANQSAANVSILLGSGSGTFAAAVNYGVGTTPTSVAIGDLDGDGNVDLAVANQGSNNVSILLGSGSGTFAAAVNYGVGSSPNSVAIGDLDGDGDLDLAVANFSSNNVSILLGSGSGTFATAVNYGVGSLPYSVAIGDLDGDGDADLAVANASSNNVSILLGSGSGTFAAAVNYGVGSLPISVAIGDLDGDGDADLAVANGGSNTVSIRLGSGSGTFAAAVNYGVGSSPNSVAIGDLDGDGDLDLAVANFSSNNVSILLGSGSGTFATAVNYGVGSLPYSVAIGDLDGDGDADLAVANATSNNVSILLNQCSPPTDTTAPSDPMIATTVPLASTWSIDNTIEVTFSGAADNPGGSGLDGYSVLFDQMPTTSPDFTVDLPHTTDPHVATSDPLADGNSWYAHISTCDIAGNCTSTVHAGPFWIDTTAPSAPGTVSSSSHSATPVADTTIDTSWIAASDALSGVVSYRYDFTTSATPPACVMLTQTTASTSTSSATLADGSWYAHACAVDNAGNTGAVATGGPFVIDSTAPTGLLLSSPSHTVSTWDDDTTIDATLSGASDANGVTGYAIAFDQNPTTDPGTTPTQAGTSYVGTATSDGNSWYAHARPCDQAGNCGAVVHLGPFWIDTAAPSAPGAVTSSSHDGGPTNDTSIDVMWGASTDVSSGVASYRYDFTNSATPGSCASLGSTTATTSASSASLATGTWHLHVCARDGVGLDSTVTSGGPYTIDLDAPEVVLIDSVAPSGGEITEGEIVNVAITQILVSFDEGMDQAIAETTGSYLLVNAGPNETLDTTGCSLAGDDVAVAIDSASYAAQTTTLGINGAVALDDGLYALVVCSVLEDLAGNAMAADFVRTFRVDQTPPRVTAVDSDADTGDGSLDPGEATNVAITEVLLSFDEALSDPPGDTTAGDVTNPASYLLVEAGVDGTLETIDCSAVDPDDTAVTIDTASWDGPSSTVTLGLNGGSALGEGLYRLFACASLTDLAGSALDGDANGTGGDDFARDFRIDQTNPSDPSTVESNSHSSGGWNQATAIAMTWTGASDDAAGLDRYRVLFDQLTTTIPDDTTTVAHAADPHGTSGGPLAEGLWYFHLSTCDVAGNCTSTVHRGPYGIDATAPSAPGTISSSSHSATPVADTTMDVSWIAATDALSGVTSYRYDFTGSATPPACAALTQTTASTSASSVALGDGSWYAHACAVDAAGNQGGVTTGGPYLIDATVPTGLSLSSSSHTVSTWNNDNTVDVTLSGATDANGVTGYAVAFDQAATTDPGTTPTQAGTSYVGTATSDGNSWYAHARACDQTGNCGAAVHLGPFWIDTTAPSTPTGVDSSSHTVGTPSNDTTIDTEWDTSTDTSSGVAGYAWVFLGSDSWGCDGVIDGTGLSTTSPALPTGQHWFHVCSVDEVGNQSAVTTIGPFELDLVGPSIVGFDTVADTGDGELSPGEITAASITQILASFNEELDQTTAENLANWVLVESGNDGTVDSGVCSVHPSDIDWSPTAASLLGDEQTVRLDVGGGWALPAGRYRLSACSGITDAVGNAIADAAIDFVLTSTNVIANPNLDDTIVPWIAGGSRPQDLGWSPTDAEGKATSGSLAVTAVGATGEDTTATACFELVPGTPFVLGGAIEVTGGSGGNPIVTVQLLGSSVVDCQSPAAPIGNVIASGPTAGWVPFAVALPGSYSSVQVVLRVAAETSPSHSVRLDLFGVDGPIFADGFESGDTSSWSSEVP